jgi:hypothetical protein
VMLTGGGAGYGDPLERARHLIEEDLDQGLIRPGDRPTHLRLRAEVLKSARSKGIGRGHTPGPSATSSSSATSFFGFFFSFRMLLPLATSSPPLANERSTLRRNYNEALSIPALLDAQSEPLGASWVQAVAQSRHPAY